MRRLGGVLLAVVILGACASACGGMRQGLSVSRHPQSTATAPTTATTSFPYVTIPGANLAQVFRDAGTELMGTVPSEAETQTFVRWYQQDEVSCEAVRKSQSCPIEASPQADAADIIREDHPTAVYDYQQAAARQRAIAGYQQYENSLCSVPATTDPDYPPGQGPNTPNESCPVGTPANPYPK